jgi:hypothetical protein
LGRRRAGYFFEDDFFDEDFFEEVFFDDDFLDDDFFAEDFFFGTFPPARRASERPIAMACLRLVTFLPDDPLLSVPFFRSRIVFSTLSCDFFPYLLAIRKSPFACA